MGALAGKCLCGFGDGCQAAQNHKRLRTLLERQEHGRGVLNVALPLVGELGHRHAIDDTVVGTPAHLRRSESNHQTDGTDVHDARGNNIVVLIKARESLCLAERSNGNLRHHEHGPKVGAANVANVGQREGAAAQLARTKLALLAQLLQTVQLLRNVEDGLVGDILCRSVAMCGG